MSCVPPSCGAARATATRGTRRRSRRSTPTTAACAGPASSRSAIRAAGRGRSRPGPTRSRPGATRSPASSRAARRTSPARRRRARCCWTRRRARAAGSERTTLAAAADALRQGGSVEAALDADLAALVQRHAGRPEATRLERPLEVDVDRVLARFGAWYELFPRSFGRLRRRAARSCRGWPSWASTCSTCRRSTRSATRTARARNNTLVAAAGDPGSPWAIGDEHGGHEAIHPDLGTFDDFDALVAAAARARHRDRAGLRDPVLGRPPVADRAPRVVQPPPGRHAQVRREPAQAATRTSTTSTGTARTGRGCGRRCTTSCAAGSTAA